MSSFAKNNVGCSSSSTDDGYKEYKPMYVKQNEWKNTGTPDGEVKVFYPTLEEFSDFKRYIEKIERQNAHLSAGICKVVAPAGWHPRPSKPPGDYSDIEEFRIECPVREHIESAINGCYVKNNTVHRKEMLVKDFRRTALSKQYRTPRKDQEDLKDLERYFWRNLLHHEPIYGADTPGSIYEPSVKEFNMNNLKTILDLLKENEVTIKGVNTVFLYFGMWKTMFPWHAEDMDLYSINYLHFGEPKFWYAIPPAAAEKFERFAAQSFPDGLQICKAFLRHKLYIISPNVLKTHGIPYGTMVQYPGEFIITFPKGYHMGFNVGYNCAESTNFALERWIDYGKNAVLCYCRKDTVEIDMQPFMKKYRPAEYKEWYDYWYGERPTQSLKTNKQQGGGSRSMMGERKGSKDTASSNGSEGGGDFSSQLPQSICTKRQKKMFQARKPMHKLWANTPPDLFNERKHNAERGKLFPHCCVCQYFLAREIWTKRPPTETLPKTSRRYVTDQMFHKNEKIDVDWTIEEDELLCCSNCHVVVHRKCYAHTQTAFGGGDDFDSNGNGNCQNGQEKGDKMKQEEWRCERCFGHSDTLIRAATCNSCQLRGGALMQVQNRSRGIDFVHVICALLLQNIQFLEPHRRRAPFSPPPRKLMPLQQQIEQCPTAELDNFGMEFMLANGGEGSPNSTGHTIADERFVGIQKQQHSISLEPNPNASSTFNDAYFSFDVPLTIKLENCHQSTSADDGPPTFLQNHIEDTVIADNTTCTDFINSVMYFGGQQNSPSSSSTSSACEQFVIIREDDGRDAHSTSNVSELSDGQKNQQKPQQHPCSYQCEVCGHQAEAEELIRCEVCSTEQGNPGAQLRFHVTCAPLADLTFERREFPGVMALCSFHSSEEQGSQEEQALLDPRRFQLNQRVYVDVEEEGLVAEGKIIDIEEQLFATVDFLDGSVSKDIFPCDIKNCECKYVGCQGGQNHIAGSMVYVDWNDDRTYQAYYRGQAPRKKFTLKLFQTQRSDGDTIEVDSDSIYRRDEPLPERVRNALLKRSSLDGKRNSLDSKRRSLD